MKVISLYFDEHVLPKDVFGESISSTGMATINNEKEELNVQVLPQTTHNFIAAEHAVSFCMDLFNEITVPIMATFIMNQISKRQPGKKMNKIKIQNEVFEFETKEELISLLINE